jgi:hypothetical protein
LHKTDAERVDVNNTDSYSLGFLHLIGHRDYYINVGGKQPWCVVFKKFILKNWISNWVPSTCSHTYVYEILTNKKKLLCYAEWKCNKSNGHLLAEIKSEEPNKLKQKECKKQQSQRPTLGARIDDENLQGTYWIHIDKNAKTFICDTSGKSQCFLHY